VKCLTGKVRGYGLCFKYTGIEESRQAQNHTYTDRPGHSCSRVRRKAVDDTAESQQSLVSHEATVGPQVLDTVERQHQADGNKVLAHTRSHPVRLEMRGPTLLVSPC
jgi:hypothetical protein